MKCAQAEFLNRPMSSDDPLEVSVDYATEAATSTAVAGRDYIPTAGTLTFVNGGPTELGFPVDVLSYALGMFSRETRASENALSTALGAAPFAVLFAWFPTLDGPVQLLAFGGSIVVFAVYAAWVLRRQPVAAR